MGDFRNEEDLDFEDESHEDESEDVEADEVLGYPKEYRVRPLIEQIRHLGKCFPSLEIQSAEEYARNVVPTLKLPEGAEGWFATLRSESLSPRVSSAFLEMVDKINEQRPKQGELYSDYGPIGNFLQDAWGPSYVRTLAHTSDALALIAKQQSGDVMIIPAQFGSQYVGVPVQDARSEIQKHEGEFALDLIACAAMYLVHPERIVHWDQIHFHCAGTEYRTSTTSPYDRAPFFMSPLGHAHYTFVTRVAPGVESLEITQSAPQFGTPTGFIVSAARQRRSKPTSKHHARAGAKQVRTKKK